MAVIIRCTTATGLFGDLHGWCCREDSLPAHIKRVNNVPCARSRQPARPPPPKAVSGVTRANPDQPTISKYKDQRALPRPKHATQTDQNRKLPPGMWQPLTEETQLFFFCWHSLVLFFSFFAVTDLSIKPYYACKLSPRVGFFMTDNRVERSLHR